MAEPVPAFKDTPLLLKARLYDRHGMEMAAIGEREDDRSIGLVKRTGGESALYEKITDFHSLDELRRLALQVVAGNPKAVQHEKTPAALALGLLAVLAAVEHGASLGGNDVQSAPASQ